MVVNGVCPEEDATRTVEKGDPAQVGWGEPVSGPMDHGK